MGQAIPARTDYCADQLGGPARQTKDAATIPKFVTPSHNGRSRAYPRGIHTEPIDATQDPADFDTGRRRGADGGIF
jgi:hypothetical protein